MSKKTTVKLAPKSPKSMTEAVKAIRVETGIKAGTAKPLTSELHGG